MTSPNGNYYTKQSIYKQIPLFVVSKTNETLTHKASQGYFQMKSFVTLQYRTSLYSKLWPTPTLRQELFPFHEVYFEFMHLLISVVFSRLVTRVAHTNVDGNENPTRWSDYLHLALDLQARNTANITTVVPKNKRSCLDYAGHRSGIGMTSTARLWLDVSRIAIGC